MLEAMHFAIQGAITHAKRQEEFGDLAGEPCGDDGGYQAVEHVLERALTQVRELRAHAHDWNEDSYCTVCGADGAA